MRAFVSALVIALVAGCTPTHPRSRDDFRSRSEGKPLTNPGEIDRNRPVITTLQTRNHEVTVYGGSGGLRFTVAGADGTVLSQMLDVEGFARSFPGLHSHFESAFAGEGWLDASADAPTPWGGL